MTTRSPFAVAARELFAPVACEVPATRTEQGWLAHIEYELMGHVLALSSRRPAADKLTQLIRRFSARLLCELHLTRRIDKHGRVYRRGLPQSRAVAVVSLFECRVLLLLSRTGAVPPATIAQTSLLLGIWQGVRLSGMLSGLYSDSIGGQDALPSGLCGEVDLKQYHAINQQ